MRPAFVIAAFTLLSWNQIGHLTKDSSLFMFEMVRCVAAPDCCWCDLLGQVVDVPLLSLVHSQVTGDTYPHSAWPVGATEVDIVSGLHVKLPPAAYLNGFLKKRTRNICV